MKNLNQLNRQVIQLQQRIRPQPDPAIWFTWSTTNDPEENVTSWKMGDPNSKINCKQKELKQKQEEYEQLKKLKNP